MSSMDRNQRLKNYHARKVRERQQLQRQQQKENVDNPTLTTQSNSANGIIKHDQNPSGVMTGTGSIARNTTTEKGGDRQFSLTNTATSRTRSSRSLFSASAANTAPNNKKYSAKKEGEGRLVVYGKPDRPPVADSAQKSDENGDGTRGPTLMAQKPIHNATSSSSSGPSHSIVKQSLRNNNVGGKTYGVDSSNAKSTNLVSSNESILSVGRPSQQTTSANISVDDDRNRNANNKVTAATTTTTNNASAAARMFAARRRRAQLEMTTTSGESVGSSGGSVASVAVMRGAATKSGDEGDSVRGGESVDSGSTKSGSGSSSSRSQGSLQSVKIGSNSSIASSKSASGYGDSVQLRQSNIVVGGSVQSDGSGSNTSSNRTPSAPFSTVSSGSTMRSIDSTDDSTIASVVSSVDGEDRDNIVGKIEAGLHSSSTTTREASMLSISSMATIPASNCQTKTNEIANDDATKSDSVENNVTSDDAEKCEPTPILRQPQNLRDRIKDVDDANSKSVRFHLSPLEREKKATKSISNHFDLIGEQQVVNAAATTSISTPPTSVSSTHPSSDRTTPQDNEGSAVSSSQPELSTLDEKDDNLDDSTPEDSDEICQEVVVAANDNHLDEEFAMFMNGLRREVAGDHTKLWSGFQSMMGREPPHHVPLNQSLHDANSGEDKRTKAKKREKIQLDPQTTKTMNTIYQQFQEENQRMNSSSRRFMRKKIYLKNDKDIAKQQREERRVAAEAAASAKMTAQVEMPERASENSGSEQADPSNNEKASSNKSHGITSLKLRPTRSTDNVEQEKSSTPKNELFNVKLRPTPPPTNVSNSFTSSISPKSFSVGVSSSTSNKPLQRQRSNSKSSSGSGKTISSNEKKNEKKNTNWMDAVKKKQKFLRMKQLAELNSAPTETNTGGSLDTSGIVLKAVSDRKKLRITPPSSPEEKEGQVPSWAKMQLRPTQRREELLSNTPTGSIGNSTPKSFSTPTTIKSTAVESQPPLCCVGDTIDLDSLPETLFPEKNATVFQLKSTDANNVSQRYVIVGTIAIVTASSRAGGSERKVDITWFCRRSAIRTLTLNVEATGATLAHANGRMPLLFESSDICLDFAQAFYRGPSKPKPEVHTPPSTLKEVPNESTNAESDDLEDRNNHNAEHESQKEKDCDQDRNPKVNTALTKEEESLLDEYREFDESEKPKLRLICLSPKGEEVVEVTVSNRPIETLSSDQPIASVKTSQPSLSDEEEKSVLRYKKMLSVGLPPDVVRNKMNLEGASANVVTTVLGKSPAEASESSVPKIEREGKSEEVEKMVSKYKKMLAMGIPADAVRHKMTLEGVEQNIIAAVLDSNEIKESSVQKAGKDDRESDPRQALLAAIKKKGSDGAKQSEPTAPIDQKAALFASIKTKGSESSKTSLSKEEDAIASKYRRMLKMGIPLDAVKHSMKKEGIEAKIALAVAEEAPSPREVDTAPVTPAKSKSKSVVGPVLTDEEEKIASKYRKMLKFCIPKDTVRHDMKKEGVSEKIVEAIFGKDDPMNTSNVAETPAKGKNTKTKGIHWTANNLRQDLFEETVFARSATKKRKLPLIYPGEDDIKKLEELFRKNDNAHGKVIKSGQPSAGSGMAKLLDISRANNVAIQLKAFNDFTLRALAETISDLDPESKIVGERVQFVSQLLPTPKELQAVKKYKGENDRLNTAELFFKQLIPVKRAEDKVTVMKTMCTLNEHAEEARAAFKTLEEVCGQVMNSWKLEQILLMVLNIGNLMNEGSVDGGVEAFKFESLPKLSQTKSADGKMTVLDYIVETFIEKGGRDTLFLNSDFPHIQESCRLSINDLCSDMNTLRKDLQLCKSELNSMKKDQAPKPAKVVPKKINDDEDVDPRKALFAAIQKRGSNSDESTLKPSGPVDPRQALFAAIKNKGAEASNPAPKSNVKYSRGVKRLESFIWKAEATLSLTERDKGAAIRACKGLAVYCGEEGGERSASSLLQILSTFATSLVAAVEKYDRRAEALKRQKAPNKNIQQKKEKENQLNKVLKKKHSAPSLQPNVGLSDTSKKSDANSPIRAKSRRSPNPKSRRKQESSNDGDARSAMFAAIKARSEVPAGVTNKVRTIDTNVKRRESRVFLVDKMLREAPANVRDDFLRGVTYGETNDPLLQKIYLKEGIEDNIPDNLKPVDPRQELFSAIKSRRQV